MGVKNANVDQGAIPQAHPENRSLVCLCEFDEADRHARRHVSDGISSTADGVRTASVATLRSQSRPLAPGPLLLDLHAGFLR